MMTWLLKTMFLGGWGVNAVLRIAYSNQKTPWYIFACTENVRISDVSGFCEQHTKPNDQNLKNLKSKQKWQPNKTVLVWISETYCGCFTIQI